MGKKPKHRFVTMKLPMRDDDLDELREEADALRMPLATYTRSIIAKREKPKRAKRSGPGAKSPKPGERR